MSSPPTVPGAPVDSNFVNPDAEAVLDVNHVLESLAHPYRREILGFLDEDPIWTKTELVSNLHAIREGIGTPSKAELTIAITHQHLPKLEQANLITIDADGSLIQRGGSYRLVREMADAAASIDIDP